MIHPMGKFSMPYYNKSSIKLNLRGMYNVNFAKGMLTDKATTSTDSNL